MKTTKHPPKPKNLVRDALRTATNRPPRACCHALDILAEHADRDTGRNIFVSVKTIMKRTRRGERQAHEMFTRLRAGGWIAFQGAPDPHAVAAYHKLYPDPRHRAPVHYIVLPTLSCPRGADSAPLTLAVKGCGNGHLRGAESDTQGVRPAATIPSLTSNPSDSRLTDSLRNESLSKNQPPTSRGGEVPVETQIVNAVDRAMEILDLAYDDEYVLKAGHGLLTLIEKNDSPPHVMIKQALRVVKWAATQIRDGSPLQYLRSLHYLWGPRFVEFEASADQWWIEDGRYEDREARK